MSPSIKTEHVTIYNRYFGSCLGVKCLGICMFCIKYFLPSGYNVYYNSLERSAYTISQSNVYFFRTKLNNCFKAREQDCKKEIIQREMSRLLHSQIHPVADLKCNAINNSPNNQL